MTSNDELSGFVRESLARDIPRNQIQEVLARAGWSAAQVRAALASFAQESFPVPIPRPRPYMDAREAFLYFVLFTTMYLSAFNIGSMIFQFIDRAFPQPHMVVTSFRDPIRWPLSILIVALPVFLYSTWLIQRDIQMDPGKRVSVIRRKLTYLTLFISAFVLIGIFSSLVYSFLGNELTTPFVLKSLTAGSIAGLVFAYYLRDMRIADKDGAA